MRTFSRPLTEKRRLPRKPTYQASKQAASQGRCVNGLTPTGDGNTYLSPPLLWITPVLMALPQQGTETHVVAGVWVDDFCVNGLTPTGDGNMGVIFFLL